MRSPGALAVVLALGAAACSASGPWRSMPVDTPSVQARVLAVQPAGRAGLAVALEVVNHGMAPVVLAPRDALAYAGGGRPVPVDRSLESAPPVVIAPGASEDLQLAFGAAARPWHDAPVFVVIAVDTGFARSRVPPLRIDWQ